MADKYTPLPKNDVKRELQVSAARRGDKAALVASVDGTIWNFVKEFSRGLTETDKEDLHSAGRVGALIAADRFDPDRGVSFNTFASWWIRAHVIREMVLLRGRGRLRGQKMFFKIARLFTEGNSIEQVAEMLQVSLSSVADVAAIISLPDVPYEAAATRDSMLKISDVVPDAQIPDALAVLCGVEGDGDLAGAIKQLTEREQHVIYRYYYLGETFPVIAEGLGLSFQRVGQIEDVAVAKLRKLLT